MGCLDLNFGVSGGLLLPDLGMGSGVIWLGTYFMSGRLDRDDWGSACNHGYRSFS